MLRLSLVLLGLLSCQCNPGSPQKKSPGSSEVQSASASVPTSKRPKGDPPAGWTLFAPSDAGFSVWLPGKPETLDAIGSKLYAVKRENGSAYMVNCADVGKGASERSVSEALIGMRLGKVGERTVLSESKVDDERGVGHQLAIELDTDKGKLVDNELLLSKGRFVCAFSALIASKQDETADIKTFFDSAELPGAP